MTVYSWPDTQTFRADSFELRVVPNTRVFTGHYTPYVQTLDLLGERWAARVELPPTDENGSGAREAFFDRLYGQHHQVSMWNLVRRAPRGTARGTLTLSGGVSQLGEAMNIAGAVAKPNLLRYAGLDLDAGGGVPAGVTLYTAGTFSGAALARGSGNGDPDVSAVVNASSLGSSSSDQVGFRWSADVAVTAGLQYSYAADVIGSAANASVALYVDWYTSGMVNLGGALTGTMVLPTSWTRMSIAGAAPATAAWARLFVWMHTRTSGTSVQLKVDNAQFEQAAAPTAFSGRPTLLAGDMLGCSGQLVRVLADATADDSGLFSSVPFSPRARAAWSNGAAVTYDKPSANFMLGAGNGVPVVHRPGYGDSISFDLIERL